MWSSFPDRQGSGGGIALANRPPIAINRRDPGPPPLACRGRGLSTSTGSQRNWRTTTGTDCFQSTSPLRASRFCPAGAFFENQWSKPCCPPSSHPCRPLDVRAPYQLVTSSIVSSDDMDVPIVISFKRDIGLQRTGGAGWQNGSFLTPDSDLGVDCLHVCALP